MMMIVFLKSTRRRAVGQASFVKHLEQQVEHIGMSLFNLVEQHNRIRMLTHLLVKLSTFLTLTYPEALPTRRLTVNFSIYSLISTRIKSVGAVKQVFGELLRKMRLSDTGRTEELT